MKMSSFLLVVLVVTYVVLVAYVVLFLVWVFYNDMIGGFFSHISLIMLGFYQFLSLAIFYIHIQIDVERIHIHIRIMINGMSCDNVTMGTMGTVGTMRMRMRMTMTRNLKFDA